jgi:hypothetical protein
MSFQDPPRRQRPARYPAFPEHEDEHPSYQGRPPWEGPPRQSAWDTGARQEYQAYGDTGAQRSIWDTGGQRTSMDSGAQRTLRNSGEQGSIWDTGAQRHARNTGAQRSLRETGEQPANGVRGANGADGELPRRPTGLFHATPGGDHARRSGARSGAGRPSRGLLPGAIAGFLAAAVAIGIANLVAAFVRPQASPIIAVGGAFIDRTPAALKNFAVEKFGENDKNMLLLGMYVTIALLAIAIGMLAWKRVAIGVAGIGLFGLFGAFVAITRPESHVTDVIPSIVGGIAGIAALLWLVQAGMSRTRPSWERGR